MRRALILLGLAAFSLLLIQGPLHGPIQQLELWLYDLRVQSMPRRDPAPELVFVAMDDASEQTLGAMPWNRTLHARMIDLLSAAGARVVVLDLIFSAPRTPAEDAALLAACRRSGRVVVGRQFDKSWRPMPLLAGLEQAAHVGNVSAPYRRDEPVRFLQLVGDPTQVRSTLALSMLGLEVATGQEFHPESGGGTGQRLSQVATLGERMIPLINVDWRSRNLLALNPPGKPYQQFSFADVLNGKVPAEAFHDKIVLIGALDDPNDRFASLRDDQGRRGEMPGVLALHGAALDTLLSGKFIRRLHFELGGFPIHPLTLTWLMAVLILSLVTLLGQKTHPLWAVAAAVAFTAVLVGFSWWAMVTHGVWLFIMPLACAVWFPLLGILLYDTVRSRSALKRFVPSHTNLEEIIRAPGALTRQETIQATIMFVDLRDYTTLSEGRDPDEVRALVSRFHTALGELVQSYGGDVCDFQGDAQMVAFGLDGRKDHALAAIRAAREVPARTQKLNDALGQQLFRAGVGICTGAVSVGFLEAGGKSQHTVLGDTTNTAARLQGKARDLGVVTVVSGTTVTSAGMQADLRELPSVTLKGKAEPHAIFELIYS